MKTALLSSRKRILFVYINTFVSNMQEPLLPGENETYSTNPVMVAPDGVPFLRVEGNKLILCNRKNHGAVSPDTYPTWEKYYYIFTELLNGHVDNERCLREMFGQHERGYLHSFGVIGVENGQVTFFNIELEKEDHETSFVE